MCKKHNRLNSEWWILSLCSHETTDIVCLITISRHVDVSFMRDCFRTKWLSHWYALRSCLCGCMDGIIKTRWIPKNLITASYTSHQRNSLIHTNLWDLFWAGVYVHDDIVNVVSNTCDSRLLCTGWTVFMSFSHLCENIWPREPEWLKNLWGAGVEAKRATNLQLHRSQSW